MSAAILSRSVRSSRLSMPRSPSSPATWWATYDWLDAPHEVPRHVVRRRGRQHPRLVSEALIQPAARWKFEGICHGRGTVYQGG